MTLDKGKMLIIFERRGDQTNLIRQALIRRTLAKKGQDEKEVIVDESFLNLLAVIGTKLDDVCISERGEGSADQRRANASTSDCSRIPGVSVDELVKHLSSLEALKPDFLGNQFASLDSHGGF